MYKLTKHAKNDRFERLVFINTYIGIGDEICSLTREEDKFREVLTSTGIILILTPDNLLATAYIATINKAYAIWKNVNPNLHLPNSLYQKIIDNANNRQFSNQISKYFNY